jgi:uncharacterized membrane protein
MTIASIVRKFIFGVLITFIVLYIAFIGHGHYQDYMREAFAHMRFHAPNWALVAQQSVAIKLHLAGAVLAFGVGIVQFVGPKGTTAHRILGWAWVVFMGTVAISSIFIRSLNHGQFSFIHIFTVITLINLPLLIYFARRKNIIGHKQTATGLFIGALIITAIFAFMPGRLMWEVFFG